MNILLTLDKIKTALQKRLGKQQKKSGKSFAAWQARGYQNEPEVSVVIESHNKSLQVMHVVDKLREWRSIEIIVIDDGSDSEHTERLTSELTRGNEFLVRANDLYENVMYNKCIRFAQADIVALLQDDDDFDSLEWLRQAISLMREHPEMVILGGQDGFDVGFIEEEHRGYAQTILSGDGKFRYVPAVNRAPMFINKPLFCSVLKNIPFSYAPFQYDDYEICLRAWLNGLTVGSYSANFKSLSAGGMRLWNNAFAKEQMRRNGPQLYDAFRDKMDEIRNLVSKANKSLQI